MNWGGPLSDSVSVYAETGYLQAVLGIVEGEKPDLNPPLIVWNEALLTEGESSERAPRRPTNNDLLARKAACTADALITLVLSAGVPGGAAVKTVASYFDVNLNPVQGFLGYKPYVSIGPTIPSILAGFSSANWLYREEVLAGAQGEIDRLQELVSRKFSGAENAAKYASKIARLEGIKQAASVAAKVTGALSFVSAGYDIYMCLYGAGK
jgi:hypothetical protein